MHNFFSKAFWFLLSFVLILLMLVSFPKERVGAFSSSSNVTFYGSDNKTPIYSVDVPFGYSLNDLSNNNLLDNSFFLTFPNGVYSGVSGVSPFVNGWYSYGNGGNIQIISDYNGIHFNSSYNSFIFIPLDNVVAGTYYCNFIAGGVLYTGSVNVFDVTSTTYFSIEFNGLARIFCRIAYRTSPLISGYNYTFEVYVFSNNFIDIQSVSLSTLNLPYFNIDYVNHLYSNSGGTLSDNSNWSQSEVNSVPYDFNSKYSFNAKLYYSSKTLVYDLDRMFNTTIGQLGSYSYLTSSIINEFKFRFMSFRNFSLDGLNIFNAILSIGRLLINIGSLVFYAVAIPFGAIIDLLVFISVLITPTSFYTFF